MIIREVKLENILSHESTRVEFIPGINVIVGPNGSGKSSIVDSILLAMLGGCTSSREVVRADLDEILRIGAQRGFISVKFEIGGSMYVLERELSKTFRRTSSTIKLAKLDGSTYKVLASGREETCKWILQLLGIGDPLVLTSTLIARQGYLTEFIEMIPSDRKERVLDLFGFSRLEEAREALIDEIKKISSEVAVLESKQRDYRRLEERIKNLELDVERVKRSLEEAKSSRYKLERDLERSKEELSRLEQALTLWAALKPLEELRTLIEKEESRVRELELRLSRLGDIDVDAVVKLLEMWGNVRVVESKLKMDLEKLKSIESTISKAVEELRKAGFNPEGDLVNFTSTLLEEISEEESRLRELLGSIDGELKVLSNIVSITVEGDRCPLCGSPIGRDKLEHIVREHKARLEELRGKMYDISDKLNEKLKLKAFLEKLRREVEIANIELPQVKERVLEARGEVDRFLDLCSNVTKTKVTKVNECPVEDIRRRVEELKSLKIALGEARRRIEELKVRFNESNYRVYKSSLEKLGVPIEGIESRYSEVRKALRELEARIADIDRSISRLEGELNAKLEELSKLKSEAENLKVELSKLKTRKAVLEALEILRDRVLGKSGILARTIMKAMRESLEANVNNILETLNKDFRIKVTEDFDIKVISGGETLSVNSLSGGERTILSIAFRLALATVLVKKQLSILVLDEPTEYLDENSRRQVFEIISKIAGSIDQVIVVTHDIEVEEIADRIFRVNKVGERSLVEVEDIAKTHIT